MSVAMPVGAASDPDGVEGLAQHAIELPLRGAGALDRGAFDEALDALGATIESRTFTDSVSYAGSCLTRNVDPLVKLLADALVRPRLSSDEHKKLIRESEFELDDLLDDDAMLGSRFFTRDVAPGHPYSRAAEGTRASLNAITRDATAASIKSRTSRANLIVGLAGDLDEASARRVAHILVEDIPHGEPVEQPLFPRDRPRGKRLTFVDKPERTQTQIYIGHLAAAYNDDNFVALMLAETAFGGTFSSRLMQKVRVERGWSYGATCRFGRSRCANSFRVELAPSTEVTVDAVELVHNMLTDLVGSGITLDEFELAKKNLLGSLAITRATARIRMLQAVSGRVLDVPDDYIDTLPARIESTSLQDVNRAVAETLCADDLLTTVVGTADRLVPTLEQRDFGPVTVAAHDSY